MRAIWSGSLSFGLINIPVKIYSAAQDRALKFKLLEKEGHCPISYMKVCRDTQKEVKLEDIVRGYEYQKGDFVVLSDDDFKAASPKKTQTIEITSFADEKEIPSEYVSKPYFIEPDKNAEKPYVLLREALKRTGKVGVARIVFKEKEHICMVKAENNLLLLIQLRYQDELRSPQGLNLPEKAAYTEKELEIAMMLITQLEEHFDAAQYHDTYTEELQKIIAQKAQGQPIRIREQGAPPPTDMRDLMNILKQSLEKAKSAKPSPNGEEDGAHRIHRQTRLSAHAGAHRKRREKVETT